MYYFLSALRFTYFHAINAPPFEWIVFICSWFVKRNESADSQMVTAVFALFFVFCL